MSAPLHIKMATTGTKVLKNFRPHETEPHGNNEIMDKKRSIKLHSLVLFSVPPKAFAFTFI